MAAKALIRDDQGNILVLYRSETHPTLAHDIDLPGGIIEEGEVTEKGLSREIWEETGLEIQLVESHQQHSWQVHDGGSWQLLYEVEHDGSDVAISWEHKGYDWLSPDEFVEYDAIDYFMHQAQAWLRQQQRVST